MKASCRRPESIQAMEEVNTEVEMQKTKKKIDMKKIEKKDKLIDFNKTIKFNLCLKDCI